MKGEVAGIRDRVNQIHRVSLSLSERIVGALK